MEKGKLSLRFLKAQEQEIPHYQRKPEYSFENKVIEVLETVRGSIQKKVKRNLLNEALKIKETYEKKGYILEKQTMFIETENVENGHGGDKGLTIPVDVWRIIGQRRNGKKYVWKTRKDKEEVKS